MSTVVALRASQTNITEPPRVMVAVVAPVSVRSVIVGAGIVGWGGGTAAAGGGGGGGATGCLHANDTKVRSRRSNTVACQDCDRLIPVTSKLFDVARPCRGFVLSALCELPDFAAVRQHGIDLQRPRAIRLKDDMLLIGRP